MRKVGSEVPVTPKPSFDSLVEMHSAEIYAYLWRYLGNCDEAEDCLQEVFLRAFKAFGRLDQESNFRAWLFKIATNTAFTHRSRRARRVSREVRLDPERVSTQESTSDRVIARERLAFLIEAINRLPKKQRSAVILRKYQELSYKEVAAVLDCTEAAARANVYQALKKLRSEFYGERKKEGS